MFVYSRIGGNIVLPCTNLVSSDCSFISWTFYKDGQVLNTKEVSGGKVNQDSAKSSRMSVTSGCALSLRDLKVDDAGSFICHEHEKPVFVVYVSLLTITSPSTITDLQPGGNLTLNCILFTYYDVGSCKSYSKNVFNLSWAAEDGSQLTKNSRLTVFSLFYINNYCYIRSYTFYLIVLTTSTAPSWYKRKWIYGTKCKSTNIDITNLEKPDRS